MIRQEEIHVTFDDLMKWREALATCAIEGNSYAQEQLKLWEIDKESFIREYIRQKAMILLLEEVNNE